MKTGLNKNGLKLTGTENSQANVCITAVEGHSSEVSDVIPILSPTFNIVIITKLFMMMAMMRADYKVRGKHPLTQLTK